MCMSSWQHAVLDPPAATRTTTEVVLSPVAGVTAASHCDGHCCARYSHETLQVGSSSSAISTSVSCLSLMVIVNSRALCVACDTV